MVLPLDAALSPRASSHSALGALGGMCNGVLRSKPQNLIFLQALAELLATPSEQRDKRFTIFVEQFDTIVRRALLDAPTSSRSQLAVGLHPTRWGDTWEVLEERRACHVTRWPRSLCARPSTPREAQRCPRGSLG